MKDGNLAKTLKEVRRENEARLQTQKGTLCGRIATVPKTPGGAGIHGTLSESPLTKTHLFKQYITQ